MKIALLLLTIGLCNISASVYSQSAKINLSLENATLKQVLDEIEKASHYKFLYRSDLIDLNKVISLTVRENSLDETMRKLLDDMKVSYNIINSNLIVLTPMQQTKISGVVTDISTGSPIPGVNISIQGTTIGTVSDENGRFALDLPNTNVSLIFSFIGYLTETVPYAGTNELKIQLVPDIKNLEEVVVIGYGTQKQASVTGSVSKVSGKDISSQAVTSFDQALQGRVAGISVVNNGSPGSSPTVRIRGIGSINFNSDPLYVVDGVPTGSIKSIAPSDIEAIDILKDASATAIYGSRGSNGVVMVTTKKGAADNKFTIEYDGYAGTQKAWKQLELLNREEYLRYGKDLLTNAGLALPARWTNLNAPIYNGATQTFAQTDTDWQDAMFRNASIQQHTLSLSGGNTTSKFYTSAGYFKQDGIMVGTSYERLNFRLNSTHNISKKLSFGETFSISNDANQGEKQVEERPQIMHMIRAVPYMPIYDPTIDGGYRGPDGVDGTDYQNPVRIAVQPTNKYHSFKMLGTAFGEYKIATWLKFKSTLGIEYGSDRQYGVTPTFVDGTYHSNTKMNISDFRLTTTSILTSNQLTLDKTLGKHYINAVAVAEQQTLKSYSLSGSGSLPDNSVQQLANPNDDNLSGGKSEEALISYIGRLQYSFANKYLLSASFRADGSSKFAPGNKWGYFKSFSAGWRLKDEAFLSAVEAISDLKLKVSYGETGFNGIGNYVWQVNQNVGGAYYMFLDNRASASFFNRLGNKDLKWETTNMTNIGLDLKLFENALYMTAEYYNRKTENLILNVMPSPSIGYSQATSTNIGSMSNKGLEFQLGYQKTVGDLSFDISGNISTNRNEVLKLDLPTTELYAGGNQDFGGDAITRTREGDPIQQFFGYKVDGIFQSQAEIDNAPAQADAKPGDIRFKDLSGPNGIPDGVIDAYDRTIIGNFLPKFIYGFNLSANYKNFDIVTFLQGSYGNDIFNGNRITMEGMARLFNAGKEVLNAWTPTNTNTSVPRAVSGDPNKNSRVSDRWIEDGSYLRVKTLTIGYTVPSKILQSVTNGTVNKVRIYVSSQNFLTFTKYKGYDPEIGARSANSPSAPWNILSSGIDYGQYPQPRTFLGGIQVTF